MVVAALTNSKDLYFEPFSLSTATDLVSFANRGAGST